MGFEGSDLITRLADGSAPQLSFFLEAGFHHLAYILTRTVAFGVEIIPFSDERATLLVEGGEVVERREREAAIFEFLSDQIEIGADEIHIEHTYSHLSRTEDKTIG
jgi:hypothetical protein